MWTKSDCECGAIEQAECACYPSTGSSDCSLPEPDIRLIAEKLFGWRWLAWVTIPIKGTAGYPDKQRSRIFVSPKIMKQYREDPSWINFWKWTDQEPEDANGDEPLQYCYCSSSGHPVPMFSDSEIRDKAMEEWDDGTIERMEFESNVPTSMEYQEGDFARVATLVLKIA